MATQRYDYPFIKETSTSSGTGAIALGGAVDSDHYTFASRLTAFQSLMYCVKWEGGFFIASGQFNATNNELSRLSVKYSSEANDANPDIPVGKTLTVTIMPVPGFVTGPIDFEGQICTDMEVSGLMVRKHNMDYSTINTSADSGGTIYIPNHVASNFYCVLDRNVVSIIMNGGNADGQKINLYIVQDAVGTYTCDTGSTLGGSAYQMIGSGNQHSDNGPHAPNSLFKYEFERLNNKWLINTFEPA